MLTNRAVFVKDPLATTIPNDGVAKVLIPGTSQEWSVLRYELASFVCDGEYRRGLERILSTYLTSLDEATQPATWVSGFYGSGKSHLVRMLEYLWRDMTLPDGARARGLVRLPADVEALFQELTIAGRREGGLWSAAGKVAASAGDSVRLALLSILFQNAGLPAQYPAAQFVLWLMENGYYNAVRAGVEAAGKTFETELRSLYVSPVLARTVLETCPNFADSETGAKQLLKAQFPLVSDISDEEMLATVETLLRQQSSTPGKIPCTLVIFDELQQYLQYKPDQIINLQNVVEACCARFGSLLLFVATGQLALVASPQLARLQGRFTVMVSLSDKDVETVVREVVLRKAEDRKSDVQAVLDQCSGEIDRHLVGTKIAPIPADKAVLVADYPLLPVRRRFWERILRAVDKAGAEGQLRTQLRVVHEAVREIATLPLGTVVAADRIYAQIAPSMLQNGTLLREVDEIIRRQDDGTPEGKLRSRICALIFLIGQLPTDPGADIGVRATVDMLADLLVEDLKAGGAVLRQRIPDLLTGMVERGELMQVGAEYRLQTRESAAWEQDYRNRYARIFNDETKNASDRAVELKAACAKQLKDVALLQGASKTPRKLELFFSQEEPKSEGAVPVWIRDEWSEKEKTVREDAQAGGPDSAIVYVFLPQRSADDLKKALAGYAAASETLQTHPAPTTREGEEARQGMLTRQAEQRRQVDLFVGTIVKDAKVFQGGGNEVVENDLRGAVQEAMKASLARLYPEFSAGDNPKWDLVKSRARQGGGDALAALGYSVDTDKHPACQQVLAYVGATGKKGVDIRKRFGGSPYGWPQDAADGAILALVASGYVLATHNGAPISVQQIDQAKLGQTEFRAQNATVTTPQRIAVRKLLTDAGVAYKNNEEGLALPQFLATLATLALAAGGEAPLPLPPGTAHLEALKALSGNDQILAVYEMRERLTQEIGAWKEAAQKARTRGPRWQSLLRLRQHANTLPLIDEVTLQVEAIRANRSLLAQPDPVAPLCARLTDALRTAITEARTQHQEAFLVQMDTLYADPTWRQLSEEEQKQIQAAHGLGPIPELRVGTEAEVLTTLDATPLTEWASKTAAISERIARALLEAAQRLKPSAVRVKLPPASLQTVPDVDAYLAAVRATILAHIEAGRPVVL